MTITMQAPTLDSVLDSIERQAKREGLLDAAEIVRYMMEPGELRRDIILAIVERSEKIGREGTK